MANKKIKKPLTQRMSIYEQEYKLKEQAKEILKKIKENPIHKFNNGNGATLCNKCSKIISTGLTKELYCSTKCEEK
jgi:ATP-dependent Lon protease